MSRRLHPVRGRPDDPGLDQPTQVLALEPTLIVTGPNEFAGLTFTLTPGEHTLGRGAQSDLRIDDPYLSRRHAAVRCGQGEVLVEDLRSSAGLYVNGARREGPTRLYAGDRIRLGRIELELVAPVERGRPAPARDEGRPRPSARFDVRSQQGEVINNVAGDQHNRYRLEIAPMRRRARRLLRSGLLLLLAGTLVYLAVFVLFGRELVDWIQAGWRASSTETEPDLPDVSFAPLVFIPVALI